MLWRLRLTHLGHAAIRVEGPGRGLCFDPVDPPGEACALITAAHAERLAGAAAAARAGDRPRVVAGSALIDWLGGRGPIDALPPPREVEGVRVEATPYAEIPWVTPREGVLKAASALRAPWAAGRRLIARAGLPPAPALAYALTLPDGARLVHIGCALHRGCDPAWLADAQAALGGADWLIAGVDWGEEAAVLEMLPGFRPKLALLADLVGDARREMGMPTRLLTPLVDRLIDQGMQVYPFAPGATFRFT